MPLLAFAYLAFIGLGLPDPLPGTLWPELRPEFGLNNAALGLSLAGLSLGYITAGLLAGRAIEALGLGGLLVASMGASAAAALGQALAPGWAVFVALSVLAGLGGGAVDAALNAFAAARFQPRHLNWMHGCYGLGATLGPALATALLAAGMGWRAGYLAAGVLLAALTLAFLATRRRWTDAPPSAGVEARIGALAVLRNPIARRQIAIFFLYTGLEAGAGQWAATVLTGVHGATPALGAASAALFWAALAAGRFGLGFLVDRVGPDRLLLICAPLVVMAALGFAFVPAVTALPLLCLLAAVLAPFYPTLMARTPARLGVAAARHAVGFQVAAAMAGVAILPGAIGLAADLLGPAAVAPALAAIALPFAALVWRLPRR